MQFILEQNACRIDFVDAEMQFLEFQIYFGATFLSLWSGSRQYLATHARYTLRQCYRSRQLFPDDKEQYKHIDTQQHET